MSVRYIQNAADGVKVRFVVNFMKAAKSDEASLFCPQGCGLSRWRVVNGLRRRTNQERLGDELTDQLGGRRGVGHNVRGLEANGHEAVVLGWALDARSACRWSSLGHDVEDSGRPGGGTAVFEGR